MKATRVLAALLGGGSLLILAQIAASAWTATEQPEVDHEEATLSFLIVSAEAKRAVDTYSERLARHDTLPGAEKLPFE